VSERYKTNSYIHIQYQEMQDHIDISIALECCRIDIKPFTQRFRDWLNSIKYTDIDMIILRASELHPEFTKGFPYWFILKKLKPEDDSTWPIIRSEGKMSALLKRWDNVQHAISSDLNMRLGVENCGRVAESSIKVLHINSNGY
jgi:hypothetical protein